MWVKLLAVVSLLYLSAAESAWKVNNVDRTVDISSQIIKVNSLVTFENVGPGATSDLLVVLSEEEDAQLAYIAVKEEGSNGKLKVSKLGKEKGFQLYKVELLKQVAKGEKVNIRIEYRATESLKPLPAQIGQKESQFVVYNGNAYYAAAYPVEKERTTVKLASGGSTLSATTVAPSKQETERVIYGPYTSQPAFNSKAIKIHYENNSPFVVATLVERSIEISHWGGNIAVEEYIELVHKGAALKGSFSRLDYQMDRRGYQQPALQHFTTSLPASAKDIYYRDEIGNISTSTVRVRANSVDVTLQPRFPLFGGWKTSYVIGYNVPSHEFLYKKGDQYSLKIRVFDHIFDNIVVEKLRTKVVLPELVQKIKVNTPYTMDRRPDEHRATYLDTFGRTVVVLEKENLTDDHMQTFTVSYHFDAINMLREPLMATTFFLCIFVFVVIYVRFDFSLVSDPAEEAKERVRSKISSLDTLVSEKQKLYAHFLNEVAHFKSTRDSSILSNAKKSLDGSRSELNDKLSNLVNTLKIDSSNAHEKAQDLLRYDQSVLSSVEGYISAVQASDKKTCPEDTTFSSKIEEARTRADNILAAL